MTTKIGSTTQQPSIKLEERITSSQGKCAQATRPPDTFERVGKPGNAKAGAAGVTLAPTVTVGGVLAVALAPVVGIVGSVLGFIASPFISTSASSAA